MAAAIAGLVGGLLSGGSADAQSSARGVHVVTYHGYHLTVPRTWPVYDLARNPTVCVRFNRHAVYLGQPSAHENCPSFAIGRTEAILVQAAPARGGAARAGASASAVPAVVGLGGDSSGWLVDHGVLVAATWAGHPGLIRRALGVRSMRALMKRAGELPAASGQPRARQAIAQIASRRSAASPGGVFTGQGFDACSTPSSSQMSAWLAHSPYRAIGVYIGGASEASCARGTLSASWVARESAAGWHLMPIYVGRQAPSNDCGCPGIHSAERDQRRALRGQGRRQPGAGVGDRAG